MKKYLATLAAASITGCATIATDPIELVNGSFVISSYGKPLAGGAAAAMGRAASDAQTFCAKQGKRALMIDSAERDIAMSVNSFSANGSAYGMGMSGSGGNVKFNFICK